MNKLRCLLILFFISIFVMATRAGHATYGEKRISLNGFWQFKTDPLLKGEKEQWHTTGYDDKSLDKMEVPGSWELMNETANYIGTAWYRTTFKTPEVFGDKRFFLEFEAVSMSYKVYVNGKLVVNQVVGNFCERYDVSGLLKKNGENSLAVEVDNRLCWGAYTNWGGIRRPVTLCVTEPLFIERQEVVSFHDTPNNTAYKKFNIDNLQTNKYLTGYSVWTFNVCSGKSAKALLKIWLSGRFEILIMMMSNCVAILFGFLPGGAIYA